jgi:isopenicillin N synthase-like dioxygenase
MRFLLYTPAAPPESKNLKNPPIGAGAHSDYGTMTLLFQDSVGGLQVKSRDNTWIDAQVMPGTVLYAPRHRISDGRVNLGDALQFWTKGLLKSTVHRVLIPPKQRYSIAYFVEPNPDVVCSLLGGEG